MASWPDILEERGRAIEGETLGDPLGANAGLEVLKRRGEPTEVVRVASRRDVEIHGDADVAVQDCRHPADQNETHPGVLKRRQQGGRVERRLSHWAGSGFGSGRAARSGRRGRPR